MWTSVFDNALLCPARIRQGLFQMPVQVQILTQFPNTLHSLLIQQKYFPDVSLYTSDLIIVDNWTVGPL